MTTDHPMIADFHFNETWEPVSSEGDPESRLSATLYLNNETPGAHVPGNNAILAMHLTAIEVHRDGETGVQHAVNPVHEEELDNLTVGFNPDGGWSTISIQGRSYVVFGEPFSP